MDGTHPRTPHAIRRAADPAAGNGPHRRAARGAFPVSPSSFVARADCEATVIRANLARRCVVFILCDGGLRPWAMTARFRGARICQLSSNAEGEASGGMTPDLATVPTAARAERRTRETRHYLILSRYDPSLVSTCTAS